MKIKYFLSIFSIIAVLFSCSDIKKSQGNFNFAVLISPSYLQKDIDKANTSTLTETSEGQIFSIVGKKMSKKSTAKYKIKHIDTDIDPRTYVVEKYQLIFFEEQKEAQKFAIRYRPFIGVYADTSSPIQLRLRAAADSAHIGTILPQTPLKKSSQDSSVLYSLKLIDSIKKPATKDSASHLQVLPQSFWAFVQGRDEQKKVIRGWALVSHQWNAQYTKFEKTNLTGLNLILSDMFILNDITTGLKKQNIQPLENLLLPKKTISLVRDGGLSISLTNIPPYGFSLQKKNENKTSTNITIKQNTFTQEFVIVNDLGIQIFPISKLFPLGPYRCAFVSSNTEITWDITDTLQQVVLVSGRPFVDDKTPASVTYLPISTKEIINRNIQSRLYQKRIFTLFSKNSQWHSSLFGTISVNDGSTTRDLTWRIASLSIPKMLQNTFLGPITHANINAEYVPSGTLKNSVDAIVAFKILQNPLLLFALKIFSDRQFNLQMLPVDTSTKYKNIDAKPIGPIMSFSKR